MSGASATQRTGATSCGVPGLDEPPSIDARWEKRPWTVISPEPIRNHMGEEPAHLPKTEVKVAYDAAALYAIFRVEDRYVRAVAAGYQDAVYKDSCVEFFFTPNSDVSNGYFNLETKCRPPATRRSCPIPTACPGEAACPRSGRAACGRGRS
jgi:hypothetical protein